MTSITTQQSQISFKSFLVESRFNKMLLIIAAASIIIQFSVFKYLYPYASFIHGDSFSYLRAADENLNINTYLVGYSRFLRFFSVFTKSDTILVSFQYLMIQTSALFVLFTIFYFYKPLKTTQTILVAFMIFNPLFLHLANLISSDCFFTSLSLIWFSLLLWIINRPSTQIVIYTAIILLLAFTVRYNALTYILISGIAFWLSILPFWKKIYGIGLCTLLCALFVCYTAYHYNKLTSIWQYSPFSGWQLANNAMYAYRYVDSTDRKPVPKKFQKLDNTIRTFFDTTHDIGRFPSEAAMASTFYMWSPGMPLMQYKNELLKNDTISTEFKRWASMGPFYKEYGMHIIKKYPWHFIKFFIWPNANKYYAPPVEFLEFFNSGNTGVTIQAQKWFGYKSQTIKSRMKDSRVWALNFYPYLSGTINIVMLFTLIFFLLLKGWKSDKVFNKILFMGAAVWLINAAFTIIASSAALRFQSFPILLTAVFVALLTDWLVQILGQIQQSKQNKIHQGNVSESYAYD